MRARKRAIQWVQRAACQHQRANGRNLGGHELGGKGVLFENLGLAPAAWPVELGDHALAVFQRDLVDAVFVG